MVAAQYLKFTHEHLAQAAQMLATQNEHILQAFPLLPEKICAPTIAYEFLEALLDRSESHGMVCEQGSQVQAFMLGNYADNPFFGRHCWVPFGGMAFKQIEPYDELRRLYAAAGNEWMADEVINHYLVCPAFPAWLQAGYSLSFGQEQVYAVASLADLRPQPALPGNLQMREVQPADAAQLFERGHWIAAHLNSSPVWEPVPQQHLDNILPEYAKLATDPECTTWVVVDDDDIVAYVVLYTVDCGPDYLLGVSSAAEFAAAAVHPDYRKRGIGRALFTHILNIARQQHYSTIFTDWRTTNLQAASYWPTFGFQPFAYRLLRRVNPRYQAYHQPPNKKAE